MIQIDIGSFYLVKHLISMKHCNDDELNDEGDLHETHADILIVSFLIESRVYEQHDLDDQVDPQ